MCAGGPGSIPGADNLDSGFQPSGVGKMRSNQYVVGRPLQKTANVNRVAMRMATCGLCSRRRKLLHVCFLAVSAGDIKVASYKGA